MASICQPFSGRYIRSPVSVTLTGECNAITAGSRRLAFCSYRAEPVNLRFERAPTLSIWRSDTGNVAVNATVALLHSIGVPRDLKVNQLGAIILKVDSFRSGVCGEKDTHRRVRGASLKRRLDALTLIAGHAAIYELQAAFLSKTMTGQ